MWQKELEKSGNVSTILIDLSRTYDCILYDLPIANVNEYGLDIISLAKIF